MSALWYTTRGAGAVALIGLTITTVLGIVDVKRIHSRRWPRFVLDTLHRNVALMTVCVLAIHIATAVLDTFAPIGLKDVIVPLVSRYRPIWVGLGALAFDVLLAVTITSQLRRRLGFRAWRGVHWAAYACWPLALVHGLGTGSDIRVRWMLVLTLACAGAVVGAVVWRVATGRTAATARLAVVAAVAGACVLATGWVRQGPLRPGWAHRAGTPTTLLASAAIVMPARFEASLSGRRAERVHGSTARIDLPLALRGGAQGSVHVQMVGRPVSGGGIALGASSVTLGPPSAPTLYRGRVTRLNGRRVTALVRAPRRPPMRLRLALAIDAATQDVTGTITAASLQ